MPALIDRTHPILAFPLPITWVRTDHCAAETVFSRLFGPWHALPEPRLENARKLSAVSPREAVDLWMRKAERDIFMDAWVIRGVCSSAAGEKLIAWISSEALQEFAC